MTTFLIIVHVLVSFALIGIVLIQGGKGAEIGAAFGAGASNTVFGASGGKSFISRLTTMVAVVFMLTSLGLTYFYRMPGTASIMPAEVSSKQETTTPAIQPKAAEAPAPTPAAPSEKGKKAD
ncbi:MAG: preprotein translocase subunit SecG [Deltaproteobacteria bacterium]|nr:preprotein translocase subunit SecG [Deltaproteobacteria bacterium]